MRLEFERLPKLLFALFDPLQRMQELPQIGASRGIGGCQRHDFFQVRERLFQLAAVAEQFSEVDQGILVIRAQIDSLAILRHRFFRLIDFLEESAQAVVETGYGWLRTDRSPEQFHRQFIAAGASDNDSQQIERARMVRMGGQDPAA